MISISPDTFALLYLGVTLLILLILWIYHNYKASRKDLFLADKTLHHCEYCLCAYLDEPGKKITQCPQCKSYSSTAVLTGNGEGPKRPKRPKGLQV